jgi:adenine-specific DNA-methyltransferase
VARKEYGESGFLQSIADYALNNSEKVFRFTEINDDAGKDTLEMKKKSAANLEHVFVVKRDGLESRYVLNAKEIYFYSKKIKIIDNVAMPTKLLTNVWADIAWEGIANEGAVKLKKGKKPEKLIRRLIDMSTNEGDIIMDYFLGSGTSAAVAHKMNRHYIGIEQLDYGDNDSVVRLKNVIKGDPTGISKNVNWTGGGSFLYCELKKYNEAFIDRIKDASNSKELLEIWKEMKKKGFIKYRVDTKDFDSNIEEFKALDLKGQKKLLLEVLDKNQLYVNYSDMEDEEFAISEMDKILNKRFYGDAE